MRVPETDPETSIKENHIRDPGFLKGLFKGIYKGSIKGMKEYTLNHMRDPLII